MLLDFSFYRHCATRHRLQSLPSLIFMTSSKSLCWIQTSFVSLLPHLQLTAVKGDDGSFHPEHQWKCLHAHSVWSDCKQNFRFSIFRLTCLLEPFLFQSSFNLVARVHVNMVTDKYGLSCHMSESGIYQSACEQVFDCDFGKGNNDSFRASQKQ